MLAQILDVQALRPKVAAIVLSRFINSRAHQRTVPLEVFPSFPEGSLCEAFLFS